MREGLDHGGDPLFHNMCAKLRSYGDADADAVVGIEIDEPSTIYRVPPSTWKVDPSAYEPDVVSIGPYNRQNPKLHPMKHHKWRYMHNLLRRRRRSSTDQYQSDSSVDELVLKLCIDKVRQSEARARRCYKAPFYISNYDFVMTLVLDGCFILELFLTSFYDLDQENDLVYAIPWMFPAIRRDLLKLENQIPFFILQDLFTTINVVAAADQPAASSLSLEKLAFEYLIQAGPLADHFELEEEAAAKIVKEAAKIYHLLHFYHMLLDPSATSADAAGSSTGAGKPSGQYGSSVFLSKKVMKNYLMPHILRKPSMRLFADDDDDAGLFMIPCAAELQDAGIQFRINPKAAVLDVAFRDGVLYIPPLSVEEDTNSVLRNLLALEQFCPSNSHYVTSYTTFLNCIVNTAKDVAILQRRSIIGNKLGSGDEVALLINRLGKDVTVCPNCHYLWRVFAEVNQYCGSKWHKHRASCMRDYFGNPWSTLSVLAAVALLLMTLIQVVFAILSYGKQ